MKRRMGFVKGYEPEPEPESKPVDLIGTTAPEEPEEPEDE